MIRFSLVLLALVNFSCGSYTHPPQIKTICGDDERVPSYESAVGRMMESIYGYSPCTGTLVSESCMISAGHCLDLLKIAEFNVPASNEFGFVTHSAAADQYSVDQIIAYNDPTIAPEKGDWAVYHLAPNEVTKLNAGLVQGFYEVKAAKSKSLTGQKLRVTGYGQSTGELNYTQQTASGEISLDAVHTNFLSYDTDTMPGNSGSALVLDTSGEIVGIHNEGGCDEAKSDRNRGTSIGDQPEIMLAIQKCLKVK